MLFVEGSAVEGGPWRFHSVLALREQGGGMAGNW